MMSEEDLEPFNEWRTSFETVVPELLDHLEWRRDHREHTAWRESLESVVSQLEELKPYLQVGEEVFHATPCEMKDEQYGVVVEKTVEQPSLEVSYEEEVSYEDENDENDGHNIPPVNLVDGEIRPKQVLGEGHFVTTPIGSAHSRFRTKSSLNNDSPSVFAALSNLNNFRTRNSK
jgi:hypothetical protein